MKLSTGFCLAFVASSVYATPTKSGFVSLDFVGTRANTHPIGRYNDNPKYFHPPQQVSSSSSGLKRRDSNDDSFSVSLGNQFTFYQISLEVGTPFQTFLPAIDTGSSDLWVSSSNNPFCARNQQEIDEGFADCSSGTFNANKSSTFVFNNSDFFIQYADGSFAQGEWGTDTLKIGTIVLTNSSIAVGLEANSSQGVFGIGFPGLESTNQETGQGGPPPFHHHGGDGGDGGDGSGNGGNGQGGDTENGPSQQTGPFTYENVPQLLKTQGHIDTVAYSLWLNDVNAQSGEILFGAVDHDKYKGTLMTIPLIQSVPGFNQPIERMMVVLSGLSLQDSTGKESLVMAGSTAALLDSGTTFSYLPNDVVSSLSNALGAEFSEDVGAYLTDCNVQNGNTSLIYNFSGANITVPLSEILFEVTDNNNNPITFNNGNEACVIGIFPSDDVILGDSFLRSAFVVYDLDNFEVSIANTNYNSTSSNIEAISGSVPSAVKAPNYSSTQVATSVQAEAVTGVFSGVSGTPGPFETGADASADITSSPTPTHSHSGTFKTGSSLSSSLGADISTSGDSMSSAPSASSDSSSSTGASGMFVKYKSVEISR
ncbi:Yps1p [Sugiyamaella lignohabitans]|uniref:Yps1p n=1 Tax=Sugiyamaella lignohabitans TaxID=796027 RepID=A0A167DZP5_9ASCO|nr:Yps1p [Sugiyamaella lignohabitans]ANB13476.1 Yps1p [Sugiyamaella lignohabitans]